MRVSGIFALIALSLILESACAWWAAAVRGIEPIILSFGAAFAAFGLNDQSSHNVEQSPFDMKKYFLNENKNDISEAETKAKKKKRKKVTKKFEISRHMKLMKENMDLNPIAHDEEFREKFYKEYRR